jgi:hypothetical protein
MGVDATESWTNIEPMKATVTQPQVNALPTLLIPPLGIEEPLCHREMTRRPSVQNQLHWLPGLTVGNRIS